MEVMVFHDVSYIIEAARLRRKYNKQGLIELAAKQGIALTMAMKKEQMIDAIVAPKMLSKAK
jgi:hypothetical protein